ncbi:hypothetical protein AB833_25005 [Chromatiales bacterium (ex Bugula neritina AB1)]|nr:hypothetical protein AB833_25005 [Chromatiales bacterium (ex Bugula neritina AB1)]
MGFTRAEFERIFPAAIGNRSFTVNGSVIESAVNSGTMRLNLSEQKYRKIASISLPFLEITFSFEGLVENEITEFMRFFDLRYQRGGG